MGLDILGMAAGPILLLIGYLHMRLNKAEEELNRMITRDDAKDLISEKLELVRVQQELLKERMDKIEESLCRMSDKIDRVLNGIRGNEACKY